MPAFHKQLAFIVLTALSTVVNAHGGHERHAPDESLHGAERGIAFALDCDAAIHELLYEYDFCIQSGIDHLHDDLAALAAYWWVARLRAEKAADNGYADAAAYRGRYRALHAAAAGKAEVSEAVMCRAVGAPCAAAFDGRSDAGGAHAARSEAPRTSLTASHSLP